MKRSHVALLITLTVALFIPLSAAQEHDGPADQEFEQELEDETREVSIEVEEDSVEIESKKDLNDSASNAFEVEFSAEEKVEMKLTYKEERATNNSEMEQELSYEVETEALIEYNDSNGNGVYDDGETVSRYDLQDASFRPIGYTTEQTQNNVTDHVITARTEDGVFEMTLHVTGSFAELGATTVEPTEVKVDIGIHNYPFESEDSQISLRTKVTTERETEREDEDSDETETGISIPAQDVTGFFTWKRTAVVDGETQQVNATIRPREETGEQTILLSYPQGERIIHDPRVGFRSADEANITPYLVALAGILLAAGLVWRYR